MKESKQLVKGLLGLVLLLLGYGVLITVRVVSVQERLNRLEASHQDMLVDYRIFSNTLAHVQMTPELLDSLTRAMVLEGRRLGAPTNRDLRLIGSELNSPPAGVSSR
jgi:hypothetical protein